MKGIRKEIFGELAGGHTVERYILTGENGLSAAILTYGATVQALCFEGHDVVLGYDTLDGYVNGKSCQGASIGRYGNRIADGRFTLNGTDYVLACNEKGVAHLHGGNIGFDRCVWTAEVVEANEPTLKLSRLSPDGEEGYPGNLQAAVTYSISADNALHIVYTAVCDKDTHYNPTCHAYFNLNGNDGSLVLEQELTIRADAYMPVDSHLISTGELRAVAGTPFDFRTPKLVGRDMAADDDQMVLVGQGYDHNYILTGEQPIAELYSPKTGIHMECFTDQPGVQLYSSVCLNEPCGKAGTPLQQYQAVCLETQHFPDTPNQPTFPTTVLKAGETFRSETVYRFFR